jgi:HD-GYP domain-containing protein (c-di-GMP phosphodiesterase class II)
MRTKHFGVRLRLWLTLSAAFIAIGWIACLLVYVSASRNQMSEIRSELATLASVIASQVDTVAHEKLVRSDQQGSPLYRDQVRKLGLALQETDDIKFVYTLRLIGGSFYFVLDPTPPGDHDGDGIDDKSYLMEAYDLTPIEAVEAIRLGTTMTSNAPVTDRWGTFLSAYAPLRHPDGRIVGVLGIDRDVSVVLDQQQRMRRDAIVIAFAIVPLGGILAFVTSLALLRARRSGVELRSGRGLNRSLLLETTLILIAVGLAVSAIVGYLGVGQDLAEERDRLNRVACLRSLQNATIVLALSNKPTRPQIDKMRRLATKAGLTWFAHRLDEETDSILAHKPGWKRTVSDLVGSLESESGRLSASRRRLTRSLAEKTSGLFMLAIIGTAIGLCALLVVRVAVRQQQDLCEAREEVRRKGEEHRDLVEQLPIGLFTYRDGEIDYANAAWTAQVRRFGQEDLTLALARALHPTDRETLLAALGRAFERGEALEATYKLSQGNEARFIECRATPVLDGNGHMSHLVGFTVDNTARELALLEVSAQAAQLAAVNAALEDTFTMLVHTLVKAVEARDPYTAGHSARVMSYSLAIGRAMGLSNHDLHVLRMGTLIHDVGKIGIPDAILRKPGRLTDEEYAIVRQHPLVGYRMIEEIPLFSECAEIVLWHHERLDGRGYPHGLREAEIPLLVRIAAVADTYDALTSTRAYREGLEVDVAQNVLREEVNKGALDRSVVATFMEILRDEGAMGWLESEMAA